MMCFDYHKLQNRKGLHLKQMGCYCIWFLYHNTPVYIIGDRPQIWVMLTTALLIERRSLLHLKATKQSPLIYMLYKDTIEKRKPWNYQPGYNGSCSSSQSSSHILFQLMMWWKEGGGSRGISYFVLSYEESSRKREKGFLEIFYSYSYIYESIYRVALNGDED